MGINTSLMDLFRLIDLFLREDESAREPLQALQLVSDYIQHKQIVAPMPTDLVNFYDDPRTAAESMATGRNPLAELPHLLAPVTRATEHPSNVAQKEQEPYSSLGVSTGPRSDSHEREPIFHVPLGMPSHSRPPRLDLALAFGDMPVPQLAQDVRLPVRAPSIVVATDHRRKLAVDVVREKLRLWLRKPDTSALRKWVLRKRQKHQMKDDDWDFADTSHLGYSPDRWPSYNIRVSSHGIEPTAEMERAPAGTTTRIPFAFPHGGVHITKDTVMHREPLPPRRPRSVSASMARPLPPLPQLDKGHEMSFSLPRSPRSGRRAASVSGRPGVGVTRVRRNSSVGKCSLCVLISTSYMQVDSIGVVRAFAFCPWL